MELKKLDTQCYVLRHEIGAMFGYPEVSSIVDRFKKLGEKTQDSMNKRTPIPLS